MDISCAKEIKGNSKGKVFHKFKGKIIVAADTIKYDNSIIVINTSNKALISIFRQGLIFPELIAASGSTLNRNHINYHSIIDTLKITDIEEVLLPNQGPILRTYKFLNWQKGFANPILYLFDLKNKTFNPTGPKSFIEGAKVTAFGFCSILI